MKGLEVRGDAAGLAGRIYEDLDFAKRALPDPLEKGMATHSSILAWTIPWTEETSGLESIGLHRVRHD